MCPGGKGCLSCNARVCLCHPWSLRGTQNSTACILRDLFPSLLVSAHSFHSAINLSWPYLAFYLGGGEADDGGGT